MIWVAWIGLVGSLILGFGAFFGAPYLPILGRDREQLLDLLDFGSGQTLLDLGSGDGTMLLAVARRGGRAIGIEINPFWWLVSVLRTLPYRGQIQVRYGNFWHMTWPKADVVYAFLIARYTERLVVLAKRQLSSPTRLASFGFALSGLELIKHQGAAYIYGLPKRRSAVAERR